MTVKTPKVTLYVHVKTDSGWKRFPAAMGRNGKLRPMYAQIGAAQKVFEVGHYELRYSADGGKTVWENVGEDAAIAQAERLHMMKKLTAAGAASAAGTK
jgi:hypothetical protein